jgi:hypothetical protein
LLLPLPRLLMQLLLLQRRKGLEANRVLLVGTRDDIASTARHLAEHPQLGVGVVGTAGLQNRPGDDGGVLPDLGPLDGLERICEEHAIDQVLVCAPLVNAGPLLMRTTIALERSSVLVSYVPDTAAYSLFACRVHDLAGQPVIDLNDCPRQRTSPLSGARRPAITRNRLVFPLPFAPTINSN